MSSWKRDFGSGLIILGPILAIVYLIFTFYRIIDGYVPNILLNAETIEPILIGVGDRIRERVAGVFRVFIFLLLFSVLILIVGYSMRTTFGNLIEGCIDTIVNRVPGLRLVYNASKSAAETALGDTQSLQEPVKIETWDGLRMTGFKTGKTTTEGHELIFIPTSPNITTGFVVETEPTNIIDSDDDIEEALIRIITAGFGDANPSLDRTTEEISINISEEKQVKDGNSQN